MSDSTPRSTLLPSVEPIDLIDAIPPLKDGDRLTPRRVHAAVWLDPSALLREDFDRLLEVLQNGLDSPEHADFVARLRETSANKS